MVSSRGMSSRTLMRNRSPDPGKKDGDPTKTSRCIIDAKARSFSVALDNVPFEDPMGISLNPFRVVVHCMLMSASEPVRRRHVPVSLLENTTSTRKGERHTKISKPNFNIAKS